MIGITITEFTIYLLLIKAQDVQGTLFEASLSHVGPMPISKFRWFNLGKTPVSVHVIHQLTHDSAYRKEREITVLNRRAALIPPHSPFINARFGIRHPDGPCFCLQLWDQKWIQMAAWNRPVRNFPH